MQQANRPDECENQPVISGQHEASDAQDENRDADPGRSAAG